MFLVSIYCAACTLTSAVAVPLSTISYRNPYSVTSFQTSRSLGGSAYGFSICFPGSSEDGDEPAFATTCNGTMIAQGVQPCNNTQVMADLILGPNKSTLHIEHVFRTKDSATYHFLGNHTLETDRPEPYTFDVYPTEAWVIKIG